MIRALALALLLPSAAVADPWMVAWTRACIADGATIYAGGLRVLPRHERRHSEPVAYCLERARAFCRHAPDPDGCRGALDVFTARPPDRAPGDRG